MRTRDTFEVDSNFMEDANFYKFNRKNCWKCSRNWHKKWLKKMQPLASASNLVCNQQEKGRGGTRTSRAHAEGVEGKLAGGWHRRKFKRHAGEWGWRGVRVSIEVFYTLYRRGKWVGGMWLKGLAIFEAQGWCFGHSLSYNFNRSYCRASIFFVVEGF